MATVRLLPRNLVGRLTLLFMLAAVLTNVAILATQVGATVYLVGYSDVLATELAKGMEEDAQGALPFFSNGRVDRQGLSDQLKSVSTMDRLEGAGIDLNDEKDRTVEILVADPADRILATTPESLSKFVGKPIQQALSPQEYQFFRDHRDTARAVTRREDFRIIGVMCLRKGGKVLARGFIKTPRLIRPASAAATAVSSLGILILATSVIAALVGAGLGYLVARHLRRSLHAISQATTRWAAGDLSVRIPPSSDVEFVKLGAQLNRMAADLSQVMELRREVAADEERRRIVRDLHDTVKQQAFALAMILAGAAAKLRQERFGDASDALRDAERQANQLQADLSQVLAELRGGPVTLLPNDLHTLATTIASVAEVTLELDLDPNCAQLPPSSRSELVAITREALTNAVKHAQASKITVSLRRSGGVWMLRIQDDGVGFGPGSTGTGLGLITIRERTTFLPMGELAVDSGDSGVEIRVTFKETNHAH